MPDLETLAIPDTAPLFAPLRGGLLALLRSCDDSDWNRPTVAGAWRVRDVAAHLLDGELRTLAAHRDGYVLASDGPVEDYADVVRLIQRLNAEGVTAGRHMSQRILIDLLAVTGAWMQEFVLQLDPRARAVFPVAWAGEAESTNLFDTAREYTERWHHEMQIRSALGARGDAGALLSATFGVPLIETALRVLPHVYREQAADVGSSFAIVVQASAWERTYSLRRESGGWRVCVGEDATAMTRVVGNVDAWWRLFFNATPADQAKNAFAVTGESRWAEPLWAARSVMV